MTEEGRLLLHIMGALIVCILGGWLAKRNAVKGAIVGVGSLPILILIAIAAKNATNLLVSAINGGIVRPLGGNISSATADSLAGLATFEAVFVVFLLYVISERRAPERNHDQSQPEPAARQPDDSPPRERLLKPVPAH